MFRVASSSGSALVALVVLFAGCSDGAEPRSNGAGGAGAGASGASAGTAPASSGVAGGGDGAGGLAGRGQGGSGAPTGGAAGKAGSGASGAAGVGASGTSGSGAGAGGGSGGAGGASSGAGNGSGGDLGNGGSGGGPPGNLTAFYLDVSGSVMAVDIATHAVRTVVPDAGQGPDGIALDLPSGHLYWTGMGVPANDDGFIMRSDLDGKNIVTIVPAGGTHTPKQLKIDHEHDKLYWSDREGMRVMRANLDGSQVETLVTTGTTAADRRDNSRWCVGIALDLEGGYFYWSQKGSDNGHVGSLRRAPITMPAGEDSTDRSDIEVLFSGLPEPIDIDLDPKSAFIYWTDRGDDTVNRAPIEIPEGATADTRADREILIEGVREAIGVTLDLDDGELFFTGGTLGRVGMARLDGTSQVDLANGTAGLTGIALALLP